MSWQEEELYHSDVHSGIVPKFNLWTGPTQRKLCIDAGI
jgi:hypothetical protein